MELLTLCFVLAWTMRHWWDGRKNDYRSPDGDYRQRVRGASQRHAGQRFAAGWGLYQLRHGWGPMAQDVRDGWEGAKEATSGWKTQAGPHPTFWDAFRGGWRGTRPQPLPRPVPIPDVPPGPAHVPEPQPYPEPAARPEPVPTDNGETMNPFEELNSLDSYRRLLQGAVRRAQTRLDAAAHAVADAERAIAYYDAAQASLAAAGLGQQTTGGLADLLSSAQDEKYQAVRGQAAAEQDMATANGLLAALTSTGQDAIQDAMAGATEAADSTRFYIPQ
jgi:hypothetical protein